MNKQDTSKFGALQRAARTARIVDAPEGRPAAAVMGPLGRPLTRDDLPPANTRRWVTRRKAEVVAGVRQGLITLAEACERYDLTVDEFLSWQRRLERHGMDGLRVTRIVELRREDREDGDAAEPARRKQGVA